MATSNVYTDCRQLLWHNSRDYSCTIKALNFTEYTWPKLDVSCTCTTAELNKIFSLRMELPLITPGPQGVLRDAPRGPGAMRGGCIHRLQDLACSKTFYWHTLRAVWSSKLSVCTVRCRLVHSNIKPHLEFISSRGKMIYFCFHV